MAKMNELCYFKTFNEGKITKEEKPEEFWNDKNYMFSLQYPDGSMYKLTFGIRAESFLLELPNGRRIIGTREDLVRNTREIESLPNGEDIRSWILHNYYEAKSWYENADQEIIESDSNKQLQYMDIKVGNKKYKLGYDSKSKEGILQMPVKLCTFNVDSIYFDIPELPLIDDGEVNAAIRKALHTLGARPPRTPYEVGYILRNK